jgi:hypothetical protein
VTAWTAERLLTRADAVLTDDGWTVERGEDDVLRAGSADASQPWTLSVVAGPAPGLVSVFALGPEPVPADRVPAVARLLVEANAGRYVGWFELDPADGELHVRSVLDVEGADLDDDQVGVLLRVLVLRSVEAMEEWRERIGDVIDGVDGDTDDAS